MGRNNSSNQAYSTRNLAVPANNYDFSEANRKSSYTAANNNLSRSSHHREDRHAPPNGPVNTHSWHNPRDASSDDRRGVPVQHAASIPAISAQERLQEYNSNMGKSRAAMTSQVTDPEEAMLVQCLALQSYHLPGNSWGQDWKQFMLNNHPVLGICCHHPKHPIKACTRFVALVGSCVVGLAITNLFYLFYVWNPKFNQPIITVVVDDEEKTTLTTGMLLLWTLGSSIHAAYNLLQWHIAACACCRPGGLCEKQACCPSLGKHLLRVLVIVIISMAVLIILTRVAISNSEEAVEAVVDGKNSTGVEKTDDSIHFFDDDNFQLEVHDVSEFEFLVGYFVEMVLALFVYYPIGGTVLFSGCLGCGRIPLLGGRPLEVNIEEKRLSRKRNGTAGSRNPTQEDSWDDVEDCEGAVEVEHIRGHHFR